MNSVLLTVDLTKAVADEAIERNDSIIISYHPIIFRGLKTLTLADSQQQSLLRLAAEGISVYSPHTAIDAAKGGLGDWLADIVSGTPAEPEEVDGGVSRPASPTKSPTKRSPQPMPIDQEDDTFSEPKRPVFMLQHHPSQLSIRESGLKLASRKHTRSTIRPTTVAGFPEGAGMGRIVRFSSPQPLIDIIDRIGLGLGNPKGFPIAIPQGKRMDEMRISSVGICAGSGGDLLRNLDVDLLFTGELSHHEALAAIEKGQCVICLFHSNTERGFLHSVLKQQLKNTIGKEWEKVRREERAKDGLSDDYLEALEDEHTEVQVSEVDRDPYGVMISKAEI
ncbi:hypothetical protein LTR66_010139 [Elasticomyces elasticus]|nr:hypothetical protein LTR66_010139 [Elasticomyces elasticus]